MAVGEVLAEQPDIPGDPLEDHDGASTEATPNQRLGTPFQRRVSNAAPRTRAGVRSWIGNRISAAANVISIDQTASAITRPKTQTPHRGAVRLEADSV